MTTSQAIVELFENFLDEKGISIPCADPIEQQDRYANGNTARIYGTEYGDLVESIDSILRKRSPTLLSTTYFVS